MIQAWLSRLWLTFFIVGFILFWQAYKFYQNGEIATAKIAVEFFASIGCFILGLVAVRLRHRGENW